MTANTDLVKLVELHDLARVEHLAEVLRAGGVEAFTRTTNDVAGFLGAPGSACVLEVARHHEAEALKLLETFEAAEPAPAAPMMEEEPSAPVSFAGYRRAATLVLGLEVISVVAGALQGLSVPFSVYIGMVFDFLIWWRFSTPNLSLASARRVRFLALTRVIIGLVWIAAGLVGGAGPSSWIQLGVLGFGAVLYLQPPAAAEAGTSSPTGP